MNNRQKQQARHSLGRCRIYTPLSSALVFWDHQCKRGKTVRITVDFQNPGWNNRARNVTYFPIEKWAANERNPRSEHKCTVGPLCQRTCKGVLFHSSAVDSVWKNCWSSLIISFSPSTVAGCDNEPSTLLNSISYLGLFIKAWFSQTTDICSRWNANTN